MPLLVDLAPDQASIRGLSFSQAVEAHRGSGALRSSLALAVYWRDGVSSLLIR
jgi:hypothetical protein